MRPALVLTAPDGSERRLLAELDDKPWAAQDGEPWRAAFPDAPDLDTPQAVQLVVAPDIVVLLRGSLPSGPVAGDGSPRPPSPTAPPR